MACHPSGRDSPVPSEVRSTVPSMSRRAPRCPECAEAPAGVPVLFGLPDAETFEAAQRGEYVLGGRLMPDGSVPEWACPRCERILA
jgi:hypothetical protein